MIVIGNVAGEDKARISEPFDHGLGCVERDREANPMECIKGEGRAPVTQSKEAEYDLKVVCELRPRLRELGDYDSAQLDGVSVK